MNRAAVIVLALAAAVLVGFAVGNRQKPAAAPARAGAAAVPDQKGGQDIFGAYMSADRHLWAVDRGTSKVIKYDRDGRFLYAWGVWGGFPGGMWGVHGFSVDQEGNVYIAEVDNGRVQKYRPRQGANPDFRVGIPVYAAWK